MKPEFVSNPTKNKNRKRRPVGRQFVCGSGHIRTTFRLAAGRPHHASSSLPPRLSLQVAAASARRKGEAERDLSRESSE